MLLLINKRKTKLIMEMYGKRKAFPFLQVGVIKCAPLLCSLNWCQTGELKVSQLCVLFCFVSPRAGL